MKLKLLIATSFLSAISFNAVSGDNGTNNEPATCSLATLKGTYIYFAQTETRAIAAMESFDGAGNYYTKSTVNSNSDVTTTVGRYNVLSDCTGTQNQEGGISFNIFIDPKGNSFSWVETDRKHINAGIESRISKAMLVTIPK
jgi:hypothetical protein